MGIENKAAILYITDNGFALARKLNSLYPYAKVFKFKPDTLSKFWGKRKNFIFIMASGIVVRTIAPLLKDKRTDPAVVVLDEKGKFSVSLLSGHLGGANKIAKEIADFLNSKRGLVGETKSHPRTEAVITTASDINGLPAIDLWAKENDLVIEKWETVSKISTRFLNSGELKVYSEVEIKMPEGFLRTDKPSSADVLVTNKKGRFTDSPIHRFTGLYLRPRNLIIGVGCNKGTSANEIENSVKTVLDENNLSFLSIHSIAAIDIKANEPGLITFAQKYNLGIKTFSANELNTLISRQPSAISFSKAAFKATGAYAVAEPSALLASGADKLLVRKQKIGNVTVAIAECGLRNDINATNAPSHPPLKLRGGRGSYECGKIRNPKSEITPKLYIVGTGPGSIVHITPYAQNAIRNSDVIVGYGTYIELIKELIKDKAIVSTGMTQEIDRCKKAVELAISGRTVSIISGGDPGIYAMAGLVFEMLKNETEKQRSGEMETKEQHRTETSPIHRFTDSPVYVLFSAHSLPEKFIDEGDPYVRHIERTIEEIIKRIPVKWHLSYQSKSGPVKWLGPSTNEKLRELAGRNIKNILMVPISFVSDHIETLYEIDILYRQMAKDLGINLKRTVSLNTHPLFIEALKDLIIKNVKELGWTE